MRWSNLSTEAEERTRLPGYRDEAVVRHFDAPEAIDTRFYEVRAKSIINRVPDASQMPFRWTINPYRGCTHACVYCLAGETRVLRTDGREVPLRDLEVGDRIYGTRRDGSYRRFVETDVLAKWASIRPALRVELDDGTELMASEDHCFLTRRGWRHVTGAEQGHRRRPHLTVGAQLLGPGGSLPAPVHDEDYRHGYLCGMVRGDADLARYSYACEGRASAVVHGFPLSWIKGFLAGLFDAEGSCSRGVLRISNTDERIIAWTVACLGRLGLDSVVDRRPDAASAIRLRGGGAARMQFLLMTDPEIIRKRSIVGAALKVTADLRVKSIEPLGTTMPMYDITTGTGDFIANGVVSHNCFARPTHTYLDFDAGRGFEREIAVKINAPERLRAELARPAWQREHIALGTNTDPYQWVEGRYKLMPGIWEAMRDASNPCSILTKSPLLLRDLELMKQINARTEFSAALSVPTLDEKAWRATEPRTPNPRARLEALAELKRAGIRTGVLVAPLMPGINDAPEQVAKILELAAEAGADYISGIALHLRGEVKDVFFDFLKERRPDLIPRYKQLYRRGAYAPVDERKRLARLVRGPEPTAGMRMRGLWQAPPEVPVRNARKLIQERLF